MKKRNVTLKSGLEIFYLEAGERSRPVIMLLHGYPTNSQLWRNVIPKLQEDFYIIAPDLPGHGQSSKPVNVDYDRDFFIQFLSEFIEELGLEKINLIGHDLGGMAALGYVPHFQDKLEHFVIMNTAPYKEWSTLNRVIVSALKNPVLSKLFLTNMGFSGLMSYAGIKNSRETIERYLKYWKEDKNSRKAFRLVVSASAEEITTPLDSIRGIKVPTMIIWGDRDNLFPFEIAKQLHTDIQGSVLVRARKSGHFVPEHLPGFISRHIKKFCL